MLNIKLKDLSDLTNLIAGIGVIASLIFLGYQVNQNTAEIRAATRHDVVSALREMTLVRAQSPELESAIAAVASCKQFTDTQAAQFQSYYLAVFVSVEEACLQFQEGRLDEVNFQTRLNGLRYYLQSEVGRSHYQNRKNNGMISPEFVRIIDMRVAELGDQEDPCG